VRKTIAVLAAAVVVVAGGFAFWRFEVAGAAPAELTLYGNVDIRQVDLAFNAEGPLQKLYKEEGDRVKSGELLAEMEPDTYQHLAELAAARLAADEATLAKAVAGNRPEDIQQAEATAAVDKATLANAEITLKRATSLLGSGAGTRQAYDDARAADDEIRSKSIASEKAAEVMRLGPRKEDIDAQRAKVDGDRAELALAQHRLSDTHLTAPADGVILTRIAEPGAVLGPTSPIYTLSLTSQIWVRSFVPEAFLGRIQPGEEVLVSTDSRPDKPYHGWIGYIAPTAEFTPKTVETPELRTQLVYRLRIFIREPDEQLRQGMPVTITMAPASKVARAK
jgi:membrane fusion protein YbhG